MGIEQVIKKAKRISKARPAEWLVFSQIDSRRQDARMSIEVHPRRTYGDAKHLMNLLINSVAGVHVAIARAGVVRHSATSKRRETA